ncbi:MAG TPA: hemerythrin domain-containing protein [Actinomycetes bacterium]|nr:hemerythrin domain-containing protein [Actinomycetes bacterium]
MPSSIARLTATDHERMLRLVRRACSPGPSQQRWREELVHLVRAHRAAEEDSLTDEVVRSTGAGAADALSELRSQDAAIDDALHRLSDAPDDGPATTALRGELTALLGRHADTLAGRVLAPMTDALPRKQMRELGGAYARSRDRALQEEGADEPPPRRLDVSRAELYELAKRAGIEGRSSMSRRDLIHELQRRQSTS